MSNDDAYAIRIIGGPAAGQDFPIRGSEVVLGRAAGVGITVPDNLLSRSHVKVLRTDEGWFVEDMGSTNGTWIRGQRLASRQPLKERRPVSIGSTLFELYRPQLATDSGDSLDEAYISAKVEAMTVDKLVRQAAGNRARKEQRHLAAIYQLQNLLTENPDESELYHQILEVISDVIPSDAAYLLKYVPEDGVCVPVAERNSQGRVGEASDMFISRSITRYVMENSEAILSMDARNDDRFGGESLCGIDIHSVMCAPMMGGKQLRGLLYVVSSQGTRRYDEEELQLLTTVAQSAALAVENRELVNANVRAERMAAIGTTAASLGHCVKNILTGLEGSVSLLRMGIDNADRELSDEAWHILSRNHRQLSALMMDLLNLAREDGLNLGMYNLTDVIIEASDLVRMQMADAGVELVLSDSVSGNPVLAEIDSRGIHRVLVNLFNNALDAVTSSTASNKRVELDYRMEHHGQIAVIEIRDNGVGIPEDKLNRVFEVFQSNKGVYGTGLGLAVCKRIVENHKGVIVVGSEVNVGSVFTVKLPVRHEATNTGLIERTSFTTE
jgi:signal transduction histidine kinase/pSer/pThr/pTyr-binding forkhead associated (FHA) protein